MTNLTLPITLSPEQGLRNYLTEIRKFPILEPEQELSLARAYAEKGDLKAAHTLVTSHLRLVAKIAMGFRGYGLPMGEVISEGNIGLMQAVKRFDPDKGFRLATYAMWWIRAAIQEYVLKSWSLVKMGTGVAHKKLFFNLRKLKSRIGAYQEGDLTPEQVSEIATTLDVSEQDVVDMDRRLGSADPSLNARVGEDGDDQWQDFLTDDTPDQETRLGDREEYAIKSNVLALAMGSLNERERDIVEQRHLREPAVTLEELSQKYGVSRERIRQVEMRAMEKLTKAAKASLPAPAEKKLLPAPQQAKLAA